VAELLIVEDDELIASSLVRAFGTRGHRAVVEGSLAGGRSRLDAADLVLCDLGLPDGDGLRLVSEVAARRPGLPVIVLTARADEADVVAGLGSGAVDYVSKPFALAELLARVDAHLRQAAALGLGPTRRAGPMRVGDLEIDPVARRVLQAGATVALRPRELDLLLRLARSAGEAVPREVLMRDVWGAGWWGSTKTLDVHVNALRRQLGEVPGSPRRIVTVRGFGYRLEAG
jgi:DNA-binding response OmpR family regulator